jgi:hypothetical protein
MKTSESWPGRLADVSLISSSSSHHQYRNIDGDSQPSKRANSKITYQLYLGILMRILSYYFFRFLFSAQIFNTSRHEDFGESSRPEDLTEQRQPRKAVTRFL